MGMADGMTTGIGLVLGMAVAGYGHRAIWAAGFAGGLAAFPGMSSGRFQSAPEEGIPGALLCGIATTAGSVAVVLPVALAGGALGIICAIAVTFALATTVAIIRDTPGWQAFALSYGITTAAAALCLLTAFVPQ